MLELYVFISIFVLYQHIYQTT